MGSPVVEGKSAIKCIWSCGLRCTIQPYSSHGDLQGGCHNFVSAFHRCTQAGRERTRVLPQMLQRLEALKLMTLPFRSSSAWRNVPDTAVDLASSHENGQWVIRSTMLKNASLWVTWSQLLDHWFQLNHICCHDSHLFREQLRLLSGLHCLSVVTGPGRLKPTACLDWGVWARFSSEPRFETASQACCVCTDIITLSTQELSEWMTESDTASLRWSILKQWVNSWCLSWFSKRLRHCLYKHPVAWLTVDVYSVQCGLWGQSNPHLYVGNTHAQTKSCELARISSQLRIADSARNRVWYVVGVQTLTLTLSHKPRKPESRTHKNVKQSKRGKTVGGSAGRKKKKELCCTAHSVRNRSTHTRPQGKQAMTMLVCDHAVVLLLM